MGRSGSRSKRRKRRKSEPAGAWTRARRAIAGFVLGRGVEEETAEHLQEIKGLVLIGISVWLFIALLSHHSPPDEAAAAGRNWGGQMGYYLAVWVLMAVGLAGYLLVLLGFAWGVVLLARKEVSWPILRLFGGLCFLLSTAFLFRLGMGDGHVTSALPYGPGGWLAAELLGPNQSHPDHTPILIQEFGGPGAWVLLSLAAVISFMLATEMAFYDAASSLGRWLSERREERGEGMAAAVWGWTRRLCSGLWAFLKGPEVPPEPSTGRAREPRGKRRTRAEATVKNERRRGRRKRDDVTGELFSEESELVDLGEAEADEGDGDWEYVDEEGNPIPADELEDYEYEDEDEDEDEEDDFEEEDDEGEDELDPDEEEWDEDGEWEEDEADEELEPVEVRPSRSKAKRAERPAPAIKAASAFDFEPPTPPVGPWKFPPVDLLEPPAASSTEDVSAVENAARRLENALRSFRVEAQVVGAKVGPTVTLFELEVAQGTRMNKVTTLSSEIAAALKAKSVRIIAPIPGKSTIGVEVPNTGGRRLVRLSQLITQKAYDKKSAALPMFLGMDTEGQAIVADMARMPHLLIAGTTGSGKSVCINTVLASLLLTRSPHDVQLILIDPKMVELMMYANVPHLMLPVVTDAKQATNVLLWTVEKMEGRYDLFKNAGVRNIASYNALGEDKLRERLGEDFDDERTPRHVPYILVVIDEMADLMMTSKKEAEQAITRLAQKSRAVGIHVIVATQRPSTDVITGVIKGNLPARIAFQVASKVDSRVILDAVGAEKLLGQGDMLYTPPQSSQIKRVQGALVEDHEIQSLVDFVCQEAAPAFNQELVQSATGVRQPGAGEDDPAEKDDLWDEAVRVILKSRRGSASLLQRALGIGYTRASRLIDMMTEAGIVGAHKGSKAREVMMSIEDWEEMHGSPTGSGVSDE